MSKPNNNPIQFRIVTRDRDEYQSYANNRAAVIDAMQASAAGPTKLYRVQDDGTERLIFDSVKCRHMKIDRIFEQAER